MQTECTPKLFEFEAVERRSVVAGFDGGNITSNAGALLLGQVDRGVGLVRRFADCFIDRRDPRYVEHQVETLVGQRIFGLALGYEDLNDHDELRKDPTFAVLAGKLSPVLRTDCEPLAGKSTLNRLEHTSRRHASKYHKIDCDDAQVDALLVDLFLEAHERAPREIVLDLDNTDIPLHGEQEGRFFHGYYKEDRYLPLYVFCGRHLLLARQRRANVAGCDGAIAHYKDAANVAAAVGRMSRRLLISGHDHLVAMLNRLKLRDQLDSLIDEADRRELTIRGLADKTGFCREAFRAPVAVQYVVTWPASPAESHA